MELDFRNRYRMMRSAYAEINELKHLWATNPMMQSEVPRLGLIIDEIEVANANILTAQGKAQRELSRNRKAEAIQSSMRLVNITRNWAEQTPGQELLLRRVSVREYQLRALPEPDLIARLAELNGICGAAAPGIADNPLTPDDYNTAGACLESFRNMQDDARKSDIARQGENSHLAELFKKANSILKRIDRLMENYKSAHPVEYARYRAARTIHDYGGRKAQRRDRDGSKPQSGKPAKADPTDDDNTE